ncbi:lipoprotein, putative [Roseobacter sp. GAI101]|nr:lipoprotein, putative [Roseobacter sp. GAI101]
MMAGAALALLSACVAPPVTPTLKPIARPTPAALPAPVVAKPTSEASAKLRSYFNQIQQAQLGSGLLRRDGGGPDTPYTADMLVRNFEQIAFYNEYNANLTGHGDKTLMRRWESPVRMAIVFGDGVPQSEQKTDTAAIRAYAGRLAGITSHPVTVGGGSPNFMVIVAGEDDRDAALVKAAQRIPGVTSASLAALRDLRRDTYCIVAAYAGGADPSVYTAAVAVIRAENPSLMRLSCIHEELAQGMGLANDSPTARPSIFNDDDEFALLTRHDENLLRMLYDPRLHAGISAEQAAPITRIIARELTAGPI